MDDRFKMLTDGDALLGDGTNFCQASFLGFVGVMSLVKGFTSSFGDISDNWLQIKINHLGKNCRIKMFSPILSTNFFQVGKEIKKKIRSLDNSEQELRHEEILV